MDIIIQAKQAFLKYLKALTFELPKIFKHNLAHVIQVYWSTFCPDQSVPTTPTQNGGFQEKSNIFYEKLSF